MQSRLRRLFPKRYSGRSRESRRRARLESLEQRITMSASSGMEAAPAIVSGDHATSATAPADNVSNMRADIPDQLYAPYVDTTLWPPYDFVELAENEGVKYVTLAFVVADPSTSEPSWGGYYSVDSGYRGDQIEALREMGGEVLVSFGGAAGTPLAAAIPDVTELTEAYQSVVDQYNLTWIDFDVEGSWVADEVSIDRRSQAIRNLQETAAFEGRPLEVWFTLPVLPSGLTNDGLYVVESALSHGVDIGGVNIMAMDYGDSAAPNPEGQMGEYAIESATSLFNQLRAAYDAAGVERTDAELWSLVGVTPMIGQNDVMTERFYVEDAQELLAFAEEKGIGMLSAWSANRDSPCETFGQLALNCSGVPQEPFEFSRTFQQFTIGADDATDGGGDTTGGEGDNTSDPGGTSTPTDSPTDNGDSPTDSDPDSDPTSDPTSDGQQGRVFTINPAGADIVDFNPATDRLDFGDISVHNLILGKLETGEVAIVNPWAWTPEYQVIKGIGYNDLSIENFGVVGNEHLRQDIGGVVSWEQGVGPREANTVYVRSHEYGVQEQIDDFDPDSMKLSFLYFGTRERLTVEDTAEGILISVKPTDQSILLTGIQKSDLVPANIEFHHDQIVEDQLEIQFGYTVEQLTLVSRGELLTPQAPPGQTTDGTQTRPGSENPHDHSEHDHSGHDHGGGDMPGMTPALSIADVVVQEGSMHGTALSTSGNQIVDADGNSVRFAGVNWFGLETSNFAPHGLWSRGYVEMMDQMKMEGFNTIRLPFSDELLEPDSIANGIDFSKNPDLEGLTGLQVMDKIIAQADKIGMRIILDHHRSDAGSGPNDSGLWYSPTYPESVWIEHLSKLASRYAGNASVVGIDLHNEPHGAATWGDGSANDWRLAAERAGNAVLAANPNLLIIVEGIEAASSGNYWWGGNLSNAGEFPVRLNVADRLVYSAHDYPASVYPQQYFNAPDYPNNLTDIWDRNWGYLFREGTAPVLLGEFGSRLETVSDQQWFASMINYLEGDLDGDGTNDLGSEQEGISWTYWSWNPNSGDTGGILQEDWQTIENSKVDALESVQFQFPETDTNAPVHALVTVQLSNPSMETVTVEYSTSDDTADSVSDFRGVDGMLMFQPGELSKTVSIEVNSDLVAEADEQFYVNLSNATHATLTNQRGTVTILDDDHAGSLLPELSILNTSATEGDTGTRSMTFAVSMSKPSMQDVTFEFATLDGTAMSPADYSEKSGLATIPAGETQQSITVVLQGDSIDEGTEEFQVRLSNPTNATLGAAQATGSIIDDDAPISTPGFAYRTTDDWGSGFNGEITLTNTGTESWSQWSLEFNWDHQVNQVWNGILVEQANGKHAIKNESWNGVVAPGGSVTIGLGGNPGNVTTLPNMVVINGIPNTGNEITPTISLNDPTFAEGDTGLTTANFLVSLSAVTSQDVTLNYTTRDGSANSATDYQEASGTLTIPAGSLSQTLTVNVIGDMEAETDETFNLEISSPQGAAISKPTGVATIQDDDDSPVGNGAEYRTVSDWGSGFNGELTLTNHSDAAWENWTVEFDWEQNLTQFWNGVLVSDSDKHYVVRNESWNGKVEPGASVTIGFGGNPGNVDSTPKNIVINGVGANGNSAPSATPLEISISDASVMETDSDTTTMKFNVVLSRAVQDGETASVRYATADGTANANGDYLPAMGVLTFLPGDLEKTIEVLVQGDTINESDETFEIALNEVVNAELAVSKATGTILDNDASSTVTGVSWSVTNQWSTGFVASIVINNTQSDSWTDWELEFDSPYEITNIWGAEIVSRVGTRYCIRPVAWNRQIATGESANIGYQVDLGSPIAPTNFTLKTS